MCRGSGTLLLSNKPAFMQKICPMCEEKGEYRDACRSCEGLAFIEKNVTERITVPKGVLDGMNLRYARKGDWSFSGPPGDLYLKLKVRPHP
jgi:molecular chaperone DnaJ